MVGDNGVEGGCHLAHLTLGGEGVGYDSRGSHMVWLYRGCNVTVPPDLSKARTREDFIMRKYSDTADTNASYDTSSARTNMLNIRLYSL